MDLMGGFCDPFAEGPVELFEREASEPRSIAYDGKTIGGSVWLVAAGPRSSITMKQVHL